MIKKVLSAVAAVAALSFPLAGVASADLGKSHNGQGSGNGPGAFGEAPGNQLSKASQQLTQQTTPRSNLPRAFRDSGGPFRAPGDYVRAGAGI
jgi:hypothetical protein